MINLPEKLEFIFIGIFFLMPIISSEDILGCGGFVKSHANIDFTKILVTLYTKLGSVKDQTECAPNSGYYFLPLYDKGEYVLKVEPPKGWSFEPAEVAFSFDSSTDVCSQGKDINFTFKGFGITGKVFSKGSDAGPKGVTISLFKNDQRDTSLSTSVTAHDGTFFFTPIQPGNYVLFASHPQWIIEKSTVKITVREENTEVPDKSLVIFGYDVSGRVTSNDEPVSGVSFLLFGQGHIKNCETSPIKEWRAEHPLCHTKSDENGRFTFPAVSPGDYRLIPHYTSTHTKFDVQPSELHFKVIQDSLVIPQDFKVTGFTVSGFVRENIRGQPLIGVKVFLSGKEVAVTDENGKYEIENIKSGQYLLKADSLNMQFEEKLIKVSPSSSEISVMIPSSYKVSGKVTSYVEDMLYYRKIAIKNAVLNFNTEVGVDRNTRIFSVFLKPAEYQISVIITEEEKKNGLQFFPLQQTINVSSKPLDNINFFQLRATLKGTIKCLLEIEHCHAPVTLKVRNGIIVKTVQVKDGEYQFSDVPPGEYEVLIDTDVFCWENPSHQLTIATEKAEIPIFQQMGYSVTFITSHDTDVEYSVVGETEKRSLQLIKGSTRHCVPKAGEYNFLPRSCHIFPRPSYKWDTNRRTPIILASTKHIHGGFIISHAAIDGVKVKIENDSGETLLLGPLKYSETNGAYKYKFQFDANADNSYIIIPLSDSLLFNPSSMRILGINECHYDIATFNGEVGTILKGSIVPPLDGVTVEIFGKDKEVPVHTLVTQNDGRYKVGPLDNKVDYSVTAKKEGYVMTRPDANGDFLVYKLAEIGVEVLDEADKKPLQGVLLSLSGGYSYRKNSITHKDGRMTFESLPPGEYYLRPMMKEYKFNPSSRIINVEEGFTVKVQLLGNRVSYSAYGSVISLNEKPEEGLLVVAQGQSECSTFVEEATTEENGNFRIRGLQPMCIYAIRLKHGEEANSKVQRVLPSSVAVQATKDINNLRLFAFHKIARMDVFVHIVSSHVDHYRTLRVKLFREDMPDSPIHVTKIDTYHFSNFENNYKAGLLVHFSSLQSDNRKYFTQLHSSLSQVSHNYKTIPVYFEANSSFKYVELNFNVEKKHFHTDINQTSSIVALPFILMIVLVFSYRQKLCIWSNNILEWWSKHIPASKAPVQAIPIDSRVDDIIVEQIMNINKKKTKSRKA